MNKCIVCYFSASGVTKAAAEQVAKAANAELFEIEPKQKYSSKDLNWTNPLARCNREKISGKSIELLNLPKDFEKYETVIIGFPVWYYTAPNVVFSFVKKVNLSGKKVAIFATSGGTGIEKVAKKFQDKLPQSIKFAGAKLIASAQSEAEISSWVQGVQNA